MKHFIGSSLIVFCLCVTSLAQKVNMQTQIGNTGTNDKLPVSNGTLLVPFTLSGCTFNDGAKTITCTSVPSGPAGGDLGGTYPNPPVVSVAHVASGILPIANGGTNQTSIPTTGATQALGFNGSIFSSVNTNSLWSTVNSVSTDGSGNFTCNFSLGYVCLINQTSNVTYKPVFTNLPTNVVITLVFKGNNLQTVVWPSNVFCNFADQYQACGSINGASTAQGGFITHYWTDGTNMYQSGDGGYLQTVKGAHGNFTDLEVYSQLNIGQPGDLEFLFGSTIKHFSNCASSASPAVCSNDIIGGAVIAAGSTTVTINTTSVTSSSQILLTRREDTVMGTFMGVTCNTQSTLVVGDLSVSAIVAATSFTVSLDVAPSVNPVCFSWHIATI